MSLNAIFPTPSRSLTSVLDGATGPEGSRGRLRSLTLAYFGRTPYLDTTPDLAAAAAVTVAALFVAAGFEVSHSCDGDRIVLITVCKIG